MSKYLKIYSEEPSNIETPHVGIYKGVFYKSNQDQTYE